MYSPENYSNTIRTLAAMAEYINHITDLFELDNVMALELLNEPWAHLVSTVNIMLNAEYDVIVQHSIAESLIEWLAMPSCSALSSFFFSSFGYSLFFFYYENYRRLRKVVGLFFACGYPSLPGMRRACRFCRLLFIFVSSFFRIECFIERYSSSRQDRLSCIGR